MKNLIYLLVLLCSFSLHSCIDCVDGNGNIITENRTNSLGSFSEIELNGSFDMELIQDSGDRKVLLEGDENILKLITTRVSNDRLIVEVKHNRCFSTRSSLNLKVSAGSISNVILSGSGNVYCDSLSTNNLYLRISGSGDMRFSKIFAESVDANIEGSGNIVLNGKCDRSYLRIDGSGDVKAYNLEQQNCDVVINGSGNVFANFTEKLTGVINGSGNLMYKTEAGDISVKINGSGSVKKSNK